MSNKTVKPHIIYNKPPNVQLLSSSQTPSCTIANMSIPPAGMIPEENTEVDERQSEKLGYWGYRHLYPFGHGYGYGYGYGRWGCYGYPCYRGSIFGHPWY